MKSAAVGLAVLFAARGLAAAEDAAHPGAPPAGAALGVAAASSTDEASRYKTEGPIVDNAASFIGVITVIPSAVIGALACPVKLASDKTDVTRTYGQKYRACVASGTAKGSQLFYTVGGYPFLLLKRAFWDAPRRVFGGGSAASKKEAPPAAGR